MGGGEEGYTLTAERLALTDATTFEYGGFMEGISALLYCLEGCLSEGALKDSGFRGYLALRDCNERIHSNNTVQAFAHCSLRQHPLMGHLVSCRDETTPLTIPVQQS